jgi:hypothetical protein
LEVFDDTPRMVEMPIFSSPFELDLGKAYIDRPPYQFEEVIAEDEAFRAKWSEERWLNVPRMLDRLESPGICYVVARPSNIDFA